MERLKAFTLLEITVAMLLTGILAALAYGILGSFSSVANRSFELGNDLQEMRELQLALTADADKARSLLNTANGFDFLEPKVRVHYVRFADGLLRTSGSRTDTFLIDLSTVRGYWAGQPSSAPDAPIEHLTLVARLAGDTLAISFTQHYDAVTRRTFE